MAEFNFDEPSVGSASEIQDTLPVSMTDLQPGGTNFSITTNRGLSQDELQDPNRIQVTIADQNAPLVILFGPPSCGKTMTLIRMTRYLKELGYKVAPIKSFRPAHDENYKRMCDNFDNMVNRSDAARSTDSISFMLVEVIKNGRRLCQILEAPGEYYFNPTNPKAKFPNYVNTIINGSNRKIWCIMLEPDWENETDRRNYVSRVHELKKRMRSADKTVFIFNKIDLTNFVIGPGNTHMGQARKEAHNLYPGMFAPFRNENPITRFFYEWRCDLVAFQTGDYTESGSGLTYQEGPHEYPRNLWHTLLKRING